MSGWHVAALLLALGLPLLLAAWSALSGRAGWALRLGLPLAAVPALWLALLPGAEASLPWLLVGARIDTGGLARPLLLLVSIAWSLAGWFAVARIEQGLRRFAVFWLLALWGIQLAAVAGDLALFYAGYAVMTLAAYGLVVHEGSREARFAGRVYLSMAILAEGALLAGVLLVASRYGLVPLAQLPGAVPLAGAQVGIAGWLLLFGFGVKIGVAGLHMWLPVAHPVAPVPASAILSGVIVKAGLVGLVRLVPSEAFAPQVQPWLLGLGLFTAFYGVAIGLTQSRLKTVLAYSTVSQMGLLFCAATLALLSDSREALYPLIGLLLLHHGLNKTALFIGAGMAPLRGWLAVGLMGLPALALAGLPLSSGALAKDGLKLAVEGAPGAVALVWLLSLSSAATALLLWRALSLARRGDARGAALHPAWPLLVAAGIVVPWLWAGSHGLAVTPSLVKALDGLWPLGLAAMGFAAWRLGVGRRSSTGQGPRIPEGDVLVPMLRLLKALSAPLRSPLPLPGRPSMGWLRDTLERTIGVAERHLGQVSAVGLGLMVLAAVIWGMWR